MRSISWIDMRAEVRFATLNIMSGISLSIRYGERKTASVNLVDVAVDSVMVLAIGDGWVVAVEDAGAVEGFSGVPLNWPDGVAAARARRSGGR
jgi:hypothetical protein